MAVYEKQRRRFPIACGRGSLRNEKRLFVYCSPALHHTVLGYRWGRVIGCPWVMCALFPWGDMGFGAVPWGYFCITL
ncbi:unnamed protein product [Tuber melanosporum]|uniref:(Perigord truffle) hypothetical protein n=1 Tax=Tuber melanosporum (strain Mel28) TaxID=656061 RepID=D5GM34_TUBMM|nr:uncharacterized protein GSTUM_00010507001 [Tuber melanosporum]CAZ85577.1 unnamed protein product [Tuber melanosporum]